ncbi:MAG: trans-aconitate 2-methyltransferase [Pirellulales bacterium]
MNQPYRWNVAEHAAGYDSGAEIVHPYYREVQDAVLAQVARPADAQFLLVDLGGGSGRLVEKCLTRFPNAQAIVVDQSEAFLELARGRLARFGDRAGFVVARLQDNWTAQLPGEASAIVSTSAIHHLRPEEKRAVYQQCYDALGPYGVLANGDEVRAAGEDEYRAALERWAAHMRHVCAAGLIDESFRRMCAKWIERNVEQFDKPRASGDDCHETIEAQLAYFCDCGFRSVSAPWQKEMWAVLLGVK